jgi:hypothetical protein
VNPTASFFPPSLLMVRLMKQLPDEWISRVRETCRTIVPEHRLQRAMAEVLERSHPKLEARRSSQLRLHLRLLGGGLHLCRAVCLCHERADDGGGDQRAGGACGGWLGNERNERDETQHHPQRVRR